ncbi:IPT/TIG domain-containing protein [Sphingobacterium sp. UT-1RO-CII-1]|uniref:IPT/TIG domain-containing protein n=1 Tax=Sphingobacterium sp. UT-1RO-CII-1 TaxID=2995225 RepID=UPI00227D0622|nr:IPT/TIG domain-containing protein [Sphingobacterium sp. UT-1RO-CII-1]MCY4778078.1 IPT/TIG domain-containing protein [Sphingobacterium sp. UT-1RO-CII-1]
MNIKRSLYGLFIMTFCLSCSKSSETSEGAHDPTLPLVLTDFSPHVGSAASKIVISGENFGNDPELIKVLIGGKEASVVGVSPTRIYVISPRRLDPANDITVSLLDKQQTFNTPYLYTLLQTVSTVSGKINADGSGGDTDGALTQAMYNNPRYLNIDEENTLFVMQYPGSKNLRIVDVVGNKVSTIPANVVKSAHGMTFKKGENVPYVVDRDGAPKIIFKLPPSNSWQPVLSFSDIKNEYSYPLDIVLDEPRNIFYIQEYTEGKILMVDATSFSSLGEAYRTNVNEIDRLALDKKGNLYIARTSSHHIIKYNPETKKAELFAGGQGVAGISNGPRLHARFNKPEAMVFDDEGNMYVADSGNHCIRKIDAAGNVTTYAGQMGKAGYSDGLPAVALFNEPTGLAVDSEGVMYVADSKNHRLRTIIIE